MGKKSRKQKAAGREQHRQFLRAKKMQKKQKKAELIQRHVKRKK